MEDGIMSGAAGVVFVSLMWASPLGFTGRVGSAVGKFVEL